MKTDRGRELFEAQYIMIIISLFLSKKTQSKVLMTDKILIYIPFMLQKANSTKSYILPLQPSGPKPYVPGAQRSQRRPTTLGLHSQRPPSESHKLLKDPVGSQLQAVNTKYCYYHTVQWSQ